MDSLAAMANSPAKAPVRSVTAPSAHNGRDDVTPVVSPRYDHLKFASHSAPSFYPDILELQAACNAAAADLATLSRKSTAILPSPVLLPTEPAGGGTAGGSGTGGTGGGGGGGSGDAALPSAHASASPPPVDACTAPASPSSSSSSSVSSASPRPPAPPSPSIHRAAAIVPAPEVTAASAAAAAAAAAANQHQQQQHQQPQPLSARSSSSSSSSTAAAAAALPLLRAAEDASTWKFERETHFNSPLSVLEFSPSVRVLVGGQVALLLKRETGVLFRYLQNQQVPLSRASPEQIAYMHQVGAIRPTVQSATFIPYTAGLEFIGTPTPTPTPTHLLVVVVITHNAAAILSLARTQPRRSRIPRSYRSHPEITKSLRRRISALRLRPHPTVPCEALPARCQWSIAPRRRSKRPRSTFVPVSWLRHALPYNRKPRSVPPRPPPEHSRHPTIG